MRKFVRTRRASPERDAPAPPPPPLALHHAPFKTNGHANGGGEAVAARVARDEYHSTLSSARWSGSEREGRAGAAGPASAPLWEDGEFPATWRALGDRKYSDVAWLRPHELCRVPRFRGDSAPAAAEPAPEPPARFAWRWRVAAGPAGVAALCAATGALALTPRLLTRVAPHQTFSAPRYTGAFTFRFWVWGAWREVAVDDRLPARGRCLLGSRCALADDFTLPLLEKAYAKLHGSYRAARTAGGGAAGALRALSGGVVQAVPLRAAGPAAAHAAPLLHSALPRSTLLLAEPHQETGAAWVVTGLARVRGGGAGAGDEALVRVRAVGGLPVPTAPAPRAVAALPPADRDLLAQRAPHPGEIWLSAGELAAAFVRLQLAHVGPDDWLLEPALAARRPWRAVLARRRWRPHYNAGGPPTEATTGANPQFQLEIGGGGGGVEEEGKCHVVVSVLQQYSPGGRGPVRGVGAAVYALGGEAARAGELPPRAAPLDVTHTARALEVVSFFTLPAGRYLVVPHGPRDAAGAFLLRLYTDAPAAVWEVNEDNLILQNIADEVEEDATPLPRAMRVALDNILSTKHDDELEVEEVRAVLRAGWGWCLARPPSRALARALAAWGDARLDARLRAACVPPRVLLLRAWREAWRREARGGGCARSVPALRLRALLRACGAAASNKVVEALCVRYAPRGRLQPEGFLLAMLALHLAHDRYRSLDGKLKSNPLSLEEMILMTVYS